MALNLPRKVAALRRMTVGELRARYVQVCGEETRSRHKDHLIRRIAWKLQAAKEGDISERARKRAQELAQGADIRLTAVVSDYSNERAPVNGHARSRRHPDSA